MNFYSIYALSHIFLALVKVLVLKSNLWWAPRNIIKERCDTQSYKCINPQHYLSFYVFLGPRFEFYWHTLLVV